MVSISYKEKREGAHVMLSRRCNQDHTMCQLTLGYPCGFREVPPKNLGVTDLVVGKEGISGRGRDKNSNLNDRSS